MREVYDTNGLLIELEGSPVTLVDKEKGIYKVEKPFAIDVMEWAEDKSNYGYSALVKGIDNQDCIMYVTKKVKQYDLFEWSHTINKQDGKYGCILCMHYDRSESVFLY